MKRSLVLSLVVTFVIGTYVAFLAWLLHGESGSLALKGQMGDSFGMLNAFFTALGFVGVSATLWLQRQQLKSQDDERLEEVNARRSLYNLNASIDATERARKLLSDHNNDRRTWIEAGRLLAHAKSLGDEVTDTSHRRVLEINRLTYRTFFSALIEHKDARFFYGVRLDGGSLDDFARASSAPSESYNGRISISQVRHLEEVSIYRVWEAAQWPERFEDPLDKAFSESERGKLLFLAEGLREYLLHRDQWSSAAGQLRRRNAAGQQEPES